MFERDQSQIAKLSAVMCRRSLHRRMTAFFVVLSLLFSQLALANYVCPGAADAVAMAEMMAAGEPCEGMDSAQPVLCHQHAADAAQSFEAVKLPAAFPPAIVQVLVRPLVPQAQAALAPAASAATDGRPPPDPVYFSTLRLRV